ncbi:Hypothetical predicted protein [Mytilus galloprovincialis]|uniref:Uncharacterized protein n=1 Tax=Mytilus galloprovincialis TaxID=29158 RepID=A0A8B6BFR0_MYTGA|nr:Hypothetical predicted protein [Mytilus galloprovincialis]
MNIRPKNHPFREEKNDFAIKGKDWWPNLKERHNDLFFRNPEKTSSLGCRMMIRQKKENSNTNQEESSSSDSNYNPTTGSSDHLSLYDWFHHNNTKKKTLRRCSLVREISGLVDTQTVEQLFSSSRKDLYFLNNLTPTNHMFQVKTYSSPKKYKE